MFSVVLVVTTSEAALLSARVEPPVNVTRSVAVEVLAIMFRSQLYPAVNESDVGVLHPLLEPAAKVKSVATLMSEFPEIPPE